MAGDHIVVDRPIYTRQLFQDTYGYKAPKSTSCGSRAKSIWKLHCKPTTSCLKTRLLGTFPIINVLRGYKWRSWLLNDIIAGLSVGILHIPQGMGFSLLAGVPPVYGLYSSFFPVLIYMLLGTSHHITMGTMALIAILIGNVVRSELNSFRDDLPFNYTSAASSPEFTELSISTATSVTLLVGIFQVSLGLLRLGFITVYLSDAFVGGLTTGAAFQIFCSQFPLVLGIAVSSHVGPLNMIYIYLELFSNIASTNVADVIISAATAAIWLFLTFAINEKFKSKLKVPIPSELVVVVVSTIISHFCELNRYYAVNIIGDVPAGFVAPSLPRVSRTGNIIIDAFVTSIVSLVLSISLAKLFARLHAYKIDTNQEMFAYGVTHIVSSFFGCFAGCTAPPRCMIFENTRGKTQLANLFSAILLVFVILFIGPLFASLPLSALGALIILNIKNLFLQMREIRWYWRKDKIDLSIWFVTFWSTVFLDLILGVAVGVAFSLLTVVLRTQIAAHTFLGHAVGSELYAPSSSYRKCLTPTGVAVYRINSPLCFTNAESFKDFLYSRCGDPDVSEQKPEDKIIVSVTSNDEHEMSSMMHCDNVENLKHDIQISSVNTHEADRKQNSDISRNTDIHAAHQSTSPSCVDVDNNLISRDSDTTGVVLDCSGVSYIDTMGANILKDVVQSYESVGTKVFLADICPSVLKSLERNEFLPKFDANVYISVHDAVVDMQRKSNMVQVA